MMTRPYDGDDAYIFLSYSHRDKDAVHEFTEKLQSYGYNVWFDEGIDPGTEWDENIADHIDRCSYFIAYITRNYIESQNCRDEINYARDLDKERLLIYGEDVELPKGMKMRMNRLQAIYRHKYKSDNDFYSKVFKAQGIDACRAKLPDPPVTNYQPVTQHVAAAGAYPATGQIMSAPGGYNGPAMVMNGQVSQGQPVKKKSKKKIIIPILIIVFAALLVAGIIAVKNASVLTLEKICDRYPEILEGIGEDDPNWETQIKGNDMYVYYTFDDYGEAITEENVDVLFESNFHMQDDSMMETIRTLEDETGLTNVRIIFVGRYENKVIFQRIWTRDGVS